MSRSISLTDFQKVLLELEPDLRRATVKGFRSAAMRMVGVVVEELEAVRPYAPVDRGELRGSIGFENEPDGAMVIADAPHAVFIEEGTRPFTPPLAPLIAWVRRKGIGDEQSAFGIARAIQRKIAREGIAPRRFMEKAWLRSAPIIHAEVLRAIGELATKKG